VTIGSFDDRMLEVLRRNSILQFGGNRTITLCNVCPVGNVADCFSGGGPLAG